MRHGKRLNIRLSETLAVALLRLALRDGCQPSEWIRRVIADAAGIPREDAEPVPVRRMDVIRALSTTEGQIYNCHFTEIGTQGWKIY